MMLADIVFGARDWLVMAAAIAASGMAALIWSYGRAASAVWVRVAAGLLKAAALAALAICLVEPLFSGTRPRPQSNLFLLVADNSRSLAIHDRGRRQSRGEELRRRMSEQASWRTRLAQDFEVRSFAFDTHLSPLKDSAQLSFDGDVSALAGSLAALIERFRDRPVAGVLLFSDGNATDGLGATFAERKATMDERRDYPPIYPVVMGADEGLADLSVSRVTVSQTNFEAAPVTIAAEIQSQGLAGRAVVLRVLEEQSSAAQNPKVIESRTVTAPPDGKPLVERFELRPEQPGISFYTVEARLKGEEDGSRAAELKSQKSAEATLLNNRRLATVDRGGGPYRVLYVSGRANWEFKFLRRALQEDDEVNLVGLVRIAKKEPKFTFRGRRGERTNPLYRGFGNSQDETAEQYDEPVLLRLGTEDKDELKGGFPKDAKDLFAYHAVILDDVEAGFFTHEQMSLIQQFVSQRGGGCLMLGGQHAFAAGGYQRTPLGELLPVYLDRGETAPLEGVRMRLTREGWLQPWVRLRPTESDEQRRLAEMPEFNTISQFRAIKPGASVLASVQSDGGEPLPALVVQQFGRGRSAALAVGDFWRWNLHRRKHAKSDLEAAWRQMLRWLVSDVPRRVEAEAERSPEEPGLMRIAIRVRDPLFEPLDNAGVSLRVETPDERQIELTAEPSDAAAGEYTATFAPRMPGAYRASVVAKAEDASEVGRREIGWSVEPATEELRTLRPNRELLAQLAETSGGELIDADELDAFVASLPNRKVPVVEAWTYPLWHQWSVFLFAAGCLIGEWGLRRWNGLP
ncbi:MAG TPA: glutamine amidotransferase [Pirellulales bacterium]